MCGCLLFHVIILWLSTRICSDFMVMDCSRECADQYYTCMHTHMHARTHTNTCMHAHMRACTHTHTHTHMHACAHTHTQTHACTHGHARTHTHTHTRMHKYTIHNLQAPASVKQVINRGLCWRKMAVQEGKKHGRSVVLRKKDRERETS